MARHRDTPSRPPPPTTGLVTGQARYLAPPLERENHPHLVAAPTNPTAPKATFGLAPATPQAGRVHPDHRRGGLLSRGLVHAPRGQAAQEPRGPARCPNRRSPAWRPSSTASWPTPASPPGRGGRRAGLARPAGRRRAQVEAHGRGARWGLAERGARRDGTPVPRRGGVNAPNANFHALANAASTWALATRARSASGSRRATTTPPSSASSRGGAAQPPGPLSRRWPYVPPPLHEPIRLSRAETADFRPESA